MIYKTDSGDYVISSHQVWVPGVFESERAAKYGFRFTNQELDQLQTIANEKNGGVIRFVDLQEWRKTTKQGGKG